jgi:putative endonuclease
VGDAATSRPWHLYLIRAADGTLYTGIATDVRRRFAEHEESGARCARYLRGRAPLQLVFTRRIGSRSLALRAERAVRRLSKRQKEEIIRTKPSARKLTATLRIRPKGKR